MAADTSRSGGSADSYIGSLISLTSKYEIRYEGVLYNINTEESSIGLRNVRSFGTEGRKKDGPQVPPSDKVYEYILFRGNDIKDLQVKSSPPVQPTQPIHNDPAIIQSHYSRPAPISTSMPPASSGPVTDLTSQTPQMGLPRPTFQGGLPLYQPGGSLGSWGTSHPPSANGSGLAVPMYWQGFYGPSGGLPHMQQQSLLRPPPGLSVPPNMQQPMQYPGMNPSLTNLASKFPPSGFSASNFPSSGFSASNFPPSGFSASNLPPSSLPASNLLPSNLSASNLPPSSLPASNLPPSNFSASNLPPSSLPSSNLPPSNFSASNLPPSSLPASNLPPSSLPASNLPPSSFSASNLPPSSSSASNLSPSNLPEFPNPLLPPGSTGALNLTSSTLTSPLTSTLAPTHSAAIASEPSPVWIPNKAPTAVIPTTTPSGSLPSVSPLTTSSMNYAIVPPMSNKPKTVTGPSLPYQSMPQAISSVVGTSSSSHSEASVPSLVTPGQLLQPGSSALSSSQSSQPAHEDVEVVQAPATSERPPSASREHQVPLLPLPSPPDQKLNGASLHTRNNYGGYRGRERGRGNGILRPVTKFTEDFDFMAMNEKFKKDEVWGHLGKNNLDKVGDGEENDEEYSHDEDDVGSSKIESKPVYVKDDFFDSLSCNSLDRGSHNGRTKFSEQMKIDTETFGDFPRHRGGRGGRGPFRGGRSRGHYGRGYGYVGRGGRGQNMSNRGNYN